MNQSKNKNYSVAWTLIVDALAEHGVLHEERGRMADQVIDALANATPPFVRPDDTVPE